MKVDESSTLSQPLDVDQGSRGVVRQIDHLLVVTHDPVGMFALFYNRLGLPAVGEESDAERFLSERQTSALGWWTGAGVSLGNIHLWFIRFEEGFEHLWQGSAWSPFATQSRGIARIEEIALEPAGMSEAAAELDARKILHDSIVSHRYDHATERTLDLHGFLGDQGLVSLSHYEYFDGRSRADVHRELAGRLDQRAGGIARVGSAAEIVVGSSNYETAIAMWRDLLSPIVMEPTGLWAFPNKCSLRLAPDVQDGVTSLKLRSTNIKEARENLGDAGLLERSTDSNELRLDRKSMNGLDIRLIP